MYWDIRTLLERPLESSDDPVIADALKGLVHVKRLEKPLFALPLPLCAELIRELLPIPLDYDDIGRFKLLKKHNPNDPDDQETFKHLIGRSPDVADAFALAVHGMNHKPQQSHAGAR